MPSSTDFPARGKVLETSGQTIVFHPTGTTYRMHLGVAARASVTTDVPVEAVLRLSARKVWTVPSGGLFVAPIVGPPRIVQGRVRWLDERQVVLNAGVNVLVELPNNDAAYALARGPIELGALVNASVLPGATFELLTQAAQDR
jgi:hypothetical protein